MSNIKALRQREADKKKQLRAILDKSAAEGREHLTEAESAEYETKLAELKLATQAVDREEHLLDLERARPIVEGEGREMIARENKNADEKKFPSFGEFLVACVRAEHQGGHRLDPRLVQAVAAGMSEAVPSDGGFLVQKDFSAEIIKRVYATGQVTSRVRRIPISSNANGMKINAIDETSRADGQRWGGVLAYWINEADQKTASKPKFRQIELDMEKLVALCYVTDELLQDAAALEAVIMDALPEELTFRTEDAIINGTGAGQPEGVVNSPSVITVPKDSADSTATVSAKDIIAMYAQLWGRSRANAVWFIDQSVEPFLYPLTVGAPSLGQYLMYSPPGQNGNGTGRLFGLPVIPIEHCAKIGTPGDIILADMSQYLMIDKGAPQAASSIHVRFLTDEMTFRFVYRVDGQSAWHAPLTPKSGGPNLSPFIVLATRS